VTDDHTAQEAAAAPAGAGPGAAEAASAGAEASSAGTAGVKLPPALQDLAAAVRAIERGEGPVHTRPARRPEGPAGGSGARPAQGIQQAGAPAPHAPAPASAGAPAAPVAAAPPGHSLTPLEAARAALAAGGAPVSLAESAVAVFGDRAGESLREDPWQVLALAGVRAEHADGFARGLLGDGWGPGDERRVRALVVWLLERAAERGHTALESSVLRAALEQRSVPDTDEALRAAVTDGRVLVFHDAEDAPGAKPGEDDEPPVRLLFGLDRYALAEESLADGLNRLLNSFGTSGPDGAGGPAEADWEAAAAAAPSASAAELIRAAAGSGLVTHSGGESSRAEPAALVATARSMGLRAYAAAHTEDGRRRLATLLGEGGGGLDATVTVAGLLAGHEGPGRDSDGVLALDLLAVLDAPQLDVELAATLVESMPDGARLVLSGDPGLLWSAGPGRAFADLLAARSCPQVIVPVRDAGEAVHRTVQLVADSVPRAIGVPAEHTQVITPGHGGMAGTRVLNAALKERLNPGPGRFGGFDPGDRVVHSAAPGRTVTGTVVSADAAGLRLDCGGAPVVVPPAEVGTTVRHGWALTAHQAAGTRWPAAVVVLPGDAVRELTRAWVYTAFSRAERHLSVVQGADQALPRAVAEIPVRERTTRLRAVLREQAVTAG